MNESILKLLSANLRIASDELENIKEESLEVRTAFASARIAILRVKDAVDETINALQRGRGERIK